MVELRAERFVDGGSWTAIPELAAISQGLDSDEDRLDYVLRTCESRDELLVAKKVDLNEHGVSKVLPIGDGYTDASLNTCAAMALLTAFTGLRFGEVAALRRRHLVLNESPARVHVVEAITEVAGHLEIGPTKTRGSRRVVPIASNRVAEAMVRYLDARPDLGPGDLLFTGRDGAPMSRTKYRARFWIPAVRFAGVTPEPGFHDLRHSFGAWMIEGGVHPKRLQERLGHTSIRTTLDVYGHLMPALDSDEADLDDLLSRRARGTYVAREGVTLHAVEG